MEYRNYIKKEVRRSMDCGTTRMEKLYDKGVVEHGGSGLDRYKKEEAGWTEGDTERKWVVKYSLVFSSIFNWHNHTHSSAGRQVTHMVSLSHEVGRAMLGLEPVPSE